MGVLLDRHFWGKALSELADLAPRIGEKISTADAAKIRKIACTALSQLLDDPEFQADLKQVIGKHGHHFATINERNYDEFLNAFMELEAKILADAGVSTVASRDLEREIRKVTRNPSYGHFERLEKKIEFLWFSACEPHAADDQKKPLWSAVWRGVKGVGLIGIDVGSAATAAVVL